MIGPKPTRTPGLSGYPQCDAELKAIADELWDGGKVLSRKNGKGQLLARLAIRLWTSLFRRPSPTRCWTSSIARTAMRRFISSSTAVTSPLSESSARFRVAGKRRTSPAVDGKSRDAPAYRIANGVTTVPLELPAYGSAFVTLRNPTTEAAIAAVPAVEKLVMGIPPGPWQVQFHPKVGWPQGSVTFTKLEDWHDSERRRHQVLLRLSATYRKTFAAPPTTHHSHLLLIGRRAPTGRGPGQRPKVGRRRRGRRGEWKSLQRPSFAANELEITVINAWFNGPPPALVASERESSYLLVPSAWTTTFPGAKGRCALLACRGWVPVMVEQGPPT